LHDNRIFLTLTNTRYLSLIGHSTPALEMRIGNWSLHLFAVKCSISWPSQSTFNRIAADNSIFSSLVTVIHFVRTLQEKQCNVWLCDIWWRKPKCMISLPIPHDLLLLIFPAGPPLNIIRIPQKHMYNFPLLNGTNGRVRKINIHCWFLRVTLLPNEKKITACVCRKTLLTRRNQFLQECKNPCLHCFMCLVTFTFALLTTK